MNIIYADFETFYSQEFTLKKLTPIQYILDPRFSVTGLAICEGNGEPFWIDGDQVEDYIRCKEDCAFVSHNALFDMCILAFHYKFVPKLVIDTLAMARAMLASELPSLSLKAVAAHLKVGVKGDTIQNAMGYDLAALPRQSFVLQKSISSTGSTTSCSARSIFKRLMEMGFPRSELAVVDTVTRCALVPQFELDVDLVAQHLSEVRYEKERLLNKAMLIATNPIDKSDIMSNEKFADALEAEGAIAPMKISRLTNKWTYAFAKTDEAFRALLEHENSRVQVLVAARLGIKSTLDESRSERFLSIGRLTSKIPIPLRYGGAHTHRLSGDWKMNMQKLAPGRQASSGFKGSSGTPGGGGRSLASRSKDNCVVRRLLYAGADVRSWGGRLLDVRVERLQAIHHQGRQARAVPRENFDPWVGLRHGRAEVPAHRRLAIAGPGDDRRP